MVNIPRNLFQVIFGFGLSNKSINGLPIDSNWLASYNDQGVFGVVVSAAIVLFVLVSAYFQLRGVRRAVALFLATYCLVASFTETGFSDASTYLLELTLAASMLVPSAGELAARRSERYRQAGAMKVMLVHNRYRSAAPSGENRVVDQEADMLAKLGHEVTRYERHSDDIQALPKAKKALLPAQVVWSPGTRRGLAQALRASRARRGACAQHVPAAERGRALCVPRGRRACRCHDSQLQARLRER